MAEIDVPQLYFSQHSILATSIGDAHDFEELLTSIKNAAWRPVIDSVQPLTELRTAHERIEAGQHFGKLVLRQQPSILHTPTAKTPGARSRQPHHAVGDMADGKTIVQRTATAYPLPRRSRESLRPCEASMP